MAPYMPPEIAYRKSKIGFNTPIVEWMQGPMKEYFLDIVHSSGFSGCTLLVRVLGGLWFYNIPAKPSCDFPAVVFHQNLSLVPAQRRIRIVFRKTVGTDARMNHDWQHAFVASFPGTALDETMYAKKVTDYLGIPSTFVEINPREAFL